MILESLHVSDSLNQLRFTLKKVNTQWKQQYPLWDFTIHGTIKEIDQAINHLCDDNETLINHVFLETDFTQIHIDYAEKFTKLFADYFEISVKFKLLSSPKYYNFENG